MNSKCPGPDKCLHIWTVYDCPSDIPHAFVARLHHCAAGETWPDAHEVVVKNSLAEVRKALPPGLFMLPRQPDDDAHIVETWF